MGEVGRKGGREEYNGGRGKETEGEGERRLHEAMLFYAVCLSIVCYIPSLVPLVHWSCLPLA